MKSCSHAAQGASSARSAAGTCASPCVTITTALQDIAFETTSVGYNWYEDVHDQNEGYTRAHSLDATSASRDDELP
jgi:hypothetical protein